MKIPFLFVRYSINLFCLSLASLQLFEIYVAFSNGESTTTLTYDSSHEKLDLPLITICPLVPFKSYSGSGVPTTENYMENTFDKEDIFAKDTLDDVGNGKWILTEQYYRLSGRCFTFKYQMNVKAMDLNSGVKIQSNASVTISIHEEGLEMFADDGLFPIKFHSTNIHGNPTLTYVDIHITRSINTILKREDNCIPIKTQSYVKCLKDAFTERTKDICYTFFMRDYADQGTMRPCLNQTDYRNTFLKIRDINKHVVRGSYCVVPCTTNRYDFYRKDLHLNQTVDGPNDSYKVAFFYDSLTIEVKKEVPVYDLPKLVSAVGGSLGLFLGFSFLSTLNGFAHVVETKIERKLKK